MSIQFLACAESAFSGTAFFGAKLNNFATHSAPWRPGAFLLQNLGAEYGMIFGYARVSTPGQDVDPQQLRTRLNSLRHR
jgi:hypothetical protein